MTRGVSLSVDTLQQDFLALGLDETQPVVCYCGSGVTATINLVALILAGSKNRSYTPVRLASGLPTRQDPLAASMTHYQTEPADIRWTEGRPASPRFEDHYWAIGDPSEEKGVCLPRAARFSSEMAKPNNTSR